jgi:hypothetical protein
MNVLAFPGFLVSSCCAFVTPIPVIWYHAAATVTTRGMTSTRDISFSKSLDLDALIKMFDRVSKFAPSG